MEPQIIDYYNEIPHGIHVIDKMNEELTDLQNKYDELENKINKFKVPNIVVDTTEEYKTYDNIICNHLKHRITDFLRDKETGLLALMQCGRFFLSNSLFDDFSNGWYKNYCADEETCKGKIINELDDITNNKNKEWCEVRIDVAFEHCLKGYPSMEDCKNIDSEFDHIIDDLIHHIYNDGGNKYLPNFYIDICAKHSSLMCNGLYDLVSYKCKECGGSGICDHGNNKRICKECGGSAICEHGKCKSTCKECGIRVIPPSFYEPNLENEYRV